MFVSDLSESELIARIQSRLASARKPIERKREEHERRIQELSGQWDRQSAAAAPERRATLEALREQLLERNYISNLIAAVDREVELTHG